MEKIDPNEARILLQEVFRNFDKNGDGSIDLKEASLVLKEIGEDVTQAQLEEFFHSIDQNHDGKISFEELFIWFTSSKGTNLPFHQSLKLKMLNLLKKTRKELQKLSESFKDEDFGQDTHSLKINIGNVVEAKTKLELQVYLGLESDQKFESFAKNLDINENAAIIIQFKSTHPEEAQGDILTILNEGKEMAKEMLPPIVDFNEIKLSAAVDGENLNIGLKYNNPLIEDVAEQYRSLLSTMIPDEFNASLAFDISLAKDIDDLFTAELAGANAQGKNIFLHLLEGTSISLEAKLTGQLLKALRNQYLGSLEWNKLPPQIKSIIPLLLLKGSKVNLNFDSGDRSLFGSIVGNQDFSFRNGVQNLKKMSIEQYVMLIPEIANFVTTAYEKLKADFTIALKGPRTLVTLHFKTSGVDKIWDYLTKH